MKLLPAFLASASAFYSGGCGDEINPSGAKCATECPGITQQGRGQKIKFKLKAQSDNSFVGEAVVQGQGWHNKDAEYVGFLRFDKKFCPTPLLRHIGSQMVSVDVLDKAGNYELEAAYYKPSSKANEHAIVQFRRGAYVQGEYIVPKTQKDKFWFSMSELSDTGITHDKIKTCFNKAILLTKKNSDGPNTNDYTKCYSYNRYGLDIDWDEDSTTQEPVTTEVVTDNPGNSGNQLPANAKCNGNILGASDNKIVGGSNANRGSWPFIVGVRMGGFMCGGTILSENVVMTAAHCCEDFVAEDITVIVNDHNQWLSDGEEVKNVRKVHMHPGYGNVNGINNDFCLLETEDLKTTGTGKIADIACLPNQGEHVLPTNQGQKLAGKNCFVAGWGTTEENGGLPEILQTLRVKIYSDDFCVQNTGIGIDPATEFCAGELSGGTDSCQGDSGGPLVCLNDDNEPVLYGVVSWGIGCARPDAPGVYGEVASVIDWIENTVGGNGGGDDDDDDDDDDNDDGGDLTTWEQGAPRIPEGLVCSNPAAPLQWLGNPHRESNERYARYAVNDKGNKIVGGLVTVKGTHNWIVKLNLDGALCGGTIVTKNDPLSGKPDWIVTAAHCCRDRGSDVSPANVRVDVGQWNRVANDAGEFTVTAERIISHPDYSDNAFNNDICLIRVPNLSSTSPNSVNVWSPACLPTQPPPAYKHCWVAGWGTTSLGGNISNKMREAGVNIFSPEECLKTGYSSTQLDFDTEFCAGIPDFNGDGVTDGGKDACQGDSGGPLVCVVNNQPVLTGVVAWGNGCAGEDFPGIYADVFNFRSWILQNIA